MIDTLNRGCHLSYGLDARPVRAEEAKEMKMSGGKPTATLLSTKRSRPRCENR